jgi:hypothetical protein
MDPLRELSERSNTVSFVSAPISLGMDPVRELLERSKYVSVVSAEILLGRDPSISF